MESVRRLYRSRGDRILGGVCGGIAEYFSVDPALVRIIAILLVIAGGGAIFAYVLAWLLIPEEPGETPPEERPRRGPNRRVLAFLLVLAGALWLSRYILWSPWVGIASIPVLLIVSGILLFLVRE